VTAVNEVGKSPVSPTSAFFKICAPAKKEAPVITEPLKDISVGLKKPITLSCIVGGVPVPQITWYKNSKSFTTRSMTYENRIAKYTIDETTETTAATYKCEATNEVGKAETSCTVTIGDAPTIDVTEKLVSQTLRVETEWSVVATIRGFPTPDMTFYKNGVKSDALQHLILRTDSETVTVSIKSLTRSHSGKYTLEAKNIHGTSSVDLTLRVIGKSLL
jgi:hypothetical protein